MWFIQVTGISKTLWFTECEIKVYRLLINVHQKIADEGKLTIS